MNRFLAMVIVVGLVLWVADVFGSPLWATALAMAAAGCAVSDLEV